MTTVVPETLARNLTDQPVELLHVLLLRPGEFLLAIAQSYLRSGPSKSDRRLDRRVTSANDKNVCPA